MNKRRVVSIILSLLMAVSFLSQGSLMVLAGEATPAEAAPAEAAGTMLTGEQEILPAEEVFF